VEEYLSPSSSSSPSSTASVDRKELALEMSSFSDSSEESDRKNMWRRAFSLRRPNQMTRKNLETHGTHALSTGMKKVMI